jgi:hypothetical protein
MKIRFSSLLPVALLAAGQLLPACQAAKVADGSSGAAQTVAVQVTPDSTEVLPGGTVQLNAVVTGSADTSVTWTVVEGGGGTISASGLYTAPSTVGSYHVRVASNADPTASATATVTVTPTPAVQVVVTPHSAAVLTGATVSFTATVSNATNTAVTWRVQEASGCGSVTAAGVYTAPAAAATCHVVATSVQDGTKSDAAAVTVSSPAAIVVAITPGSAAINSCLTASFTASVTGTTDGVVTWSITEGAAGGTITSAGRYTAPANAGTYHVVATSRASTSSTATATVTVTDRIVSVAVSPGGLDLAPGATGQFTATVTTTCGSFASLQSVTAPQ